MIIRVLTMGLSVAMASMAVAQDNSAPEKPAAAKAEAKTGSGKTASASATSTAATEKSAPKKPTPEKAAVGPAAPDLKDFKADVQQAVWDRVIAGATWWVEHQGQASHGCYGFRLKVPEKQRVGEYTIFDMASLTKVVSTTPCVMQLIEQGKVKLDAPVHEYIPEFTGQGRENITVRELMAHTSGMKPDLSMKQIWTGYDTAIRLICETPPDNPPDKKFRYSDINFILLGEIVHRVSGETLDAYAKKHVFEPLGMKDTGYNPSPDLRDRIAASEKDEKGVMLHGVVHDPTARRMAGVAGHAGLFSTAADVARYARMILNDGELDGVRVLKLETVKLMEAIHTPTAMAEKRALGWDVDTHYSRPRGGFPLGTSFGHTGFTGTCLWIDPWSRSFYVFLSSRLHETDKHSDHRKLYEVLGTEVAKVVLPKAKAAGAGAGNGENAK